jgi:hypothetical protein
MAETSNDEPLEPDAGNADEGRGVRAGLAISAMRFSAHGFYFLDRIYRINEMEKPNLESKKSGKQFWFGSVHGFLAS